MSFFSLILALLLEQARPMIAGNPVHASARTWGRWVLRKVDAGHPTHGWLAWGVVVGVPALVTLVVYWLLILLIGWPIAVLWSVAVLYVTLGFRQFSHHFTDIRKALEAGDEDEARRLLAAWQQIDASELPRQEIIRHVIEHSVLSAQRHVFGVLTWFSILAALGFGPAGAVLYRMSELVSRYWPYLADKRGIALSEAARAAAAQAWQLVDWLPARLTAIGFAVVGSFEDAIDCWRSLADQEDVSNDAVVLAATAGAINVRLGTIGVIIDAQTESPSSVQRQEPQLAHLRSVVGLVWRLVVMWVLLLALLTLARLLG